MEAASMTSRLPRLIGQSVVGWHRTGAPLESWCRGGKMAIRDENVEAVRNARQSLCRKFGGLGGWFRHLQQRDQRRNTHAAAEARRRKSLAGK